MAQYIGVEGIARTVKKQYVGVDGIARNVKKGYVGVDGVARQFFSGGKPAWEYDVGDSVFLPFNGASTEFIIVHQGIPDDSVYDASCEGTWLLMKNQYRTLKWDSSNNDYANSSAHSTLNGTTLGLFDSDVQSYIKQVKIPYWNGTGTSGSLATGANGLSAKIFLLSGYEVGFENEGGNYADTFPVDGVCLDYFYYCDDSQRATGSVYWLRSAYIVDTSTVWCVGEDGTKSVSNATTTNRGLRPALILDFDTPFDPETNILV